MRAVKVLCAADGNYAPENEFMRAARELCARAMKHIISNQKNPTLDGS